MCVTWCLYLHGHVCVTWCLYLYVCYTVRVFVFVLHGAYVCVCMCVTWCLHLCVLHGAFIVLSGAYICMRVCVTQSLYFRIWGLWGGGGGGVGRRQPIESLYNLKE